MLAQAPRENARSRSWRTHYKNWLIDGVLHFTDALILAGSGEQLLCVPTMRLSLIKQGLQKAINIEETNPRFCVHTFHNRFEEERRSLQFDIDTLVRWTESVLGCALFQPQR